MASVARSMSATNRSSEPLWELHKPLEMARHRSRDALVVILAGAVFLTLVGGVLLYKGDADAMWRLADLDNLLEIEPSTASMPPIDHVPSVPAPLPETESSESETISAEPSDERLLAAVSNGSMATVTTDVPTHFDLPPQPLPKEVSPELESYTEETAHIANSDHVAAQEEISELAEVDPASQQPAKAESEPTPQPLPSFAKTSGSASADADIPTEPIVSDATPSETSSEPAPPAPWPFSFPAVAKTAAQAPGAPSEDNADLAPPPPTELAADDPATFNAEAAESAEHAEPPAFAGSQVATQPAADPPVADVDEPAMPPPAAVEPTPPPQELAARPEPVAMDSSFAVTDRDSSEPRDEEPQKPFAEPKAPMAALSIPPPEMPTSIPPQPAPTSMVQQTSASMPEEPVRGRDAPSRGPTGFEIAWNNPTAGTGPREATDAPPPVATAENRVPPLGMNNSTQSTGPTEVDQVPSTRKVIPAPVSYGSSPYIVSDQAVGRPLPASIPVPTPPSHSDETAMNQPMPIATSRGPENSAGLPTEETGTESREPAGLNETATPPRVIAKSVPVAQGTVAASLPVTTSQGGANQPVNAPREAIATTAREQNAPRQTKDIPTTNASLAAVGDRVAPPASERFVLVQNVPSHHFLTPLNQQPQAAEPAPSPAASAEVVTYDVHSYIILDGDSFDTIARERYRTEGYGAALAHYNRSKLASDQPLASGNRILLPPIDVLRKANQRNIATASAAASNMPQPVPDFEVQASSAPSRPNMAAAQVPTNFPDVIPGQEAPQARASAPADPVNTSVGKVTPEPGAPVYRVEKQETLYAIARQTLGDGRRWREIYELNSDQLRSEYDVPIGISLRLPTDALRR